MEEQTLWNKAGDGPCITCVAESTVSGDAMGAKGGPVGPRHGPIQENLDSIRSKLVDLVIFKTPIIHISLSNRSSAKHMFILQTDGSSRVRYW